MSDAPDGTFSKLMELSETPLPPPPDKPATRPAAPKPAPTPTVDLPVKPIEDVDTVPHISQNYRFTDEELRWLRGRSFDLSEQHGAKISQNTILRIALRELREACERNPQSNPLLKNVARLKK